MLAELYDYAIKQNLAIEPGWSEKNIRAYINLSKEGEFLNVLLYQTKENKKKKLAPDIGSEALGSTKCNFPVEKFGIIFCLPEKNGEIKKTTENKHSFFWNKIEEISESVDEATACLNIFNDKEKFEQVKNELEQNKIKSGDIIGFTIDGKFLEDLENFKIWYRGFKAEKSISKEQDSDNSMICFITGESVTPMNTTPKIAGLQSVGGHSSGDALISCDKSAFASYGLEKAQNACVSEEAMSAIKGAIEDLIKNAKYPNIPGCKMLHWYKESISKELDLLNSLDFDLFEEDEYDEETEKIAEEKEKKEDLKKASEIIKNLMEGKDISAPENIYYILALAGAGGRMVVKSWIYGRYEELCNNIQKWYEDLKLLDSSKSWKPKKLSKYFYRLLKPQSVQKNPFDRMNKELSKISTEILYAIIKNTPLPDTVATKALVYINSELLKSDDKKRIKSPDRIACSLLKAWLLRKKEVKNKMASDLDKNNDSVSYNLGRLFAVYSNIQSTANPNVNTGVTEKFFRSASTTPAFVFGKLSQLAVHHLSKIENEGTKIFYKKMLSEISEKLPSSLPKRCTLIEQSEFAIGCYHQYATIFRKKEDKGEKENVD